MTISIVAMALLVAAIVTGAEVGFIYFIYLITRRALK